MSWTNPDDVIDAWIGEGVPTDTAKIQVWIDRAEREIRRNVSDIETRLDEEDSSALLDDVKDVVTAMVTRVFRNPEGIRQVSEGTGPFTASRTYGGDLPGELVIRDNELASLLSPADGTSQAYTVSMIPIDSPFYSRQPRDLWTTTDAW